MQEFLEKISVVYLPDLKVHGTVENLGAYASEVKYSIDDVEYHELMDNEDFIILDEINIMHFKEYISHEELEEK